jgi:hypothetical protein
MSQTKAHARRQRRAQEKQGQIKKLVPSVLSAVAALGLDEPESIKRQTLRSLGMEIEIDTPSGLRVMRALLDSGA